MQHGFYIQVCFANSPWLLVDRASFFFFIFCFSAPLPTLGDYQGDNLTHLMLITAFYLIQPEGHWEPSDKVGSLSQVEWLVGFQPGTFQF